MVEDYTIVLEDDESIAENTLTWQDLYAANFAYDLPFQLILADGNILYAEKVLRIIPRKRMVIMATWKNKLVVAKLFYDPDSGKRHMDKDITGVNALKDNKIPTPTLMYVGTADDKRINVLLFERINQAISLENLWAKNKVGEEIYPHMKKIIHELATHHVLGILQKDLHLKNFLVTNKEIYTLDGGQIAHFPRVLSKKESMNNLALFLSQLGVGEEAYQTILYHHYADARGWAYNRSDLRKLFSMIRTWSLLRWQRFRKKIRRNSTEFATIKRWTSAGIYHRDYARSEFISFLRNPEAVFNDPRHKILKLGRSTTVIKVRLDDKELVVKRYNMKGIFHRIRRLFRETRASSAWYFSQKLQLFYVATPKPVAFIEKRFMFLRGKSYFVSEYVPGEHADDFFIRHQHDEKATDIMVLRIGKLLNSLVSMFISHGDLKITNFIIDENQRPQIIDFDGAIEHTSSAPLYRAWRKELVRFLRNFKDQPQLLEKFKKALSIR